MDEEEKYWQNLEKLYVHNVYEAISCKYDEFFKLDQQCTNFTNNNSDNNQSANEEGVDTLVNNLKEAQNSLLTTKNVNTNDLLTLNKPTLNGKASNKLKLKNHLKNGCCGGASCSNAHMKKYNAWPKVKQFLLQLEPNSFVADVGCGEGKYMNLSQRVFMLGCDRCSSLCEIAAERKTQSDSAVNKNQILVCDNLALPFRSNLFDAVISIGVIHHLSTAKRRVQAVQELCRILRPGGKLMIYVWAMEQRLRKFNCQDVLVPLLNTKETQRNQVKFHLRRDLSNNSSVNSEDSNDESSYDRSLKTETYFNLINNENKKVNKLEEANPHPNKCSNEKNKLTISLPPNEEKKEAEFHDDSPKTPSTPLITFNCPDSPSEKNRNFVNNLKHFFSRKFTKSPNSDSNDEKKFSFSPNSFESLSTIEKYKRIIEENKDLLPKNFTIRQFPYSSCSDTFSPTLNITSNDEAKESDSPNSLQSQSPLLNSPVNPKESSLDMPHLAQCENAQLENTDPQTQQPTTTTTNNKSESDMNALNDDSNNDSNKRFYHVFKRGELDDLVKENCKNLIAYDSYYDHGNWCICAMKEKEDCLT